MKIIRNGLLIAMALLGSMSNLFADPITLRVQVSPDEQEINIYFGDYHEDNMHVGDYARTLELMKIVKIMRHDVCCLVESKGSCKPATFGAMVGALVQKRPLGVVPGRIMSQIEAKLLMDCSWYEPYRIRTSSAVGIYNLIGSYPGLSDLPLNKAYNQLRREYWDQETMAQGLGYFDRNGEEVFRRLSRIFLDLDLFHASMERKSFLLDLHNKLKELGIESFNAECRLEDTWQKRVDLADSVVKEVEGYQDQEWLSEYEKVVKSVRKEIQKHRSLLAKHKDLANCDMDKVQDVLIKRKEYSTFESSDLDFPLVNMKAIHLRCRTRKKIGLFAMGERHIHDIAAQYRQKGWRDVYQDGYIDCVKDISSIKQFLKQFLSKVNAYWSPYESFVKFCKKFPQYVPKNVMTQEIMKRSKIKAPKESLAVKRSIQQYKDARMPRTSHSRFVGSGLMLAGGGYWLYQRWFGNKPVGGSS